MCTLTLPKFILLFLLCVASCLHAQALTITSPTTLPVLTTGGATDANPATAESFVSILTASGGTPPYHWELVDGPDSVTITYIEIIDTYKIEGRAERIGDHLVTIAVEDRGSPRNRVEADLTLTVQPGPLQGFPVGVIGTSTRRENKSFEIDLEMSGGTPNPLEDEEAYQWEVLASDFDVQFRSDGRRTLLTGTTPPLRPGGSGENGYEVELAASDYGSSPDTQEGVYKLTVLGAVEMTGPDSAPVICSADLKEAIPLHGTRGCSVDLLRCTF